MSPTTAINTIKFPFNRLDIMSLLLMVFEFRNYLIINEIYFYMKKGQCILVYKKKIIDKNIILNNELFPYIEGWSQLN